MDHDYVAMVFGVVAAAVPDAVSFDELLMTPEVPANR
jgi:hypothetical protein